MMQLGDRLRDVFLKKAARVPAKRSVNLNLNHELVSAEVII
jgi:hypothetical protein